MTGCSCLGPAIGKSIFYQRTEDATGSCFFLLMCCELLKGLDISCNASNATLIKDCVIENVLFQNVLKTCFEPKI